MVADLIVPSCAHKSVTLNLFQGLNSLQKDGKMLKQVQHDTNG
jgi:hypothetical protein